MTAQRAKSTMGQRNFHAGLAAEDGVARHYADGGLQVANRRWRGTQGEIDLVLQDGRGLVFVEVKKSRSFTRAVESLSVRQIQRIVATASEYLGTQPMGQMTGVRFDLAVVDAHGSVQVIENAFGEM